MNKVLSDIATKPAINALFETQNVVRIFHSKKPENVYLKTSALWSPVFFLEMMSSSIRKGTNPIKITGAVAKGGYPRLIRHAPAVLRIKYFFLALVPNMVGAKANENKKNKLT